MDERGDRYTDMAMADVPFNPEIWHKHILPLLAPRYLGRASAVSKPWARCCAVHVKKLVAVQTVAHFVAGPGE